MEKLNTEEIVKNLLGNDAIDFSKDAEVVNAEAEFLWITHQDENFRLIIYNDLCHWECEVVETGICAEVERGVIECPVMRRVNHLTHEYYYILDWRNGAEEKYKAKL